MPTNLITFDLAASAAMNRANSAGEAGGTASEQTLTQLITCSRHAVRGASVDHSYSASPGDAKIDIESWRHGFSLLPAGMPRL